MTSQTKPQRNRLLRELRRESNTRYMTGALGDGFDANKLGEDIAAKFFSSNKDSVSFTFEHWILTYTTQELNSRIISLGNTATAIRSYGISVIEESTHNYYKLHLSKK